MSTNLPPNLFEVQVNVNQTELHQLLSTLTSKVSTHEKVIESLVADLKSSKSNLDSLRQTVQDSVVNMKRQIQAHDTQLRLAQQNADVSVSVTQFNSSMFNMNDELKRLVDRVGLVEENSSKTVLSSMQQQVKDYVQNWYQETCLKDAAERETKLVSGIQDQLQNDQLKEIRQQLNERASEERVQLLLDSLRTDVIRNKKNQSEEIEKLSKAVFENEKSSDRQFSDFLAKMEGRFDENARRISTLFDLMSISETEAFDVTHHGPAPVRGPGGYASSGGATPQPFERSNSTGGGVPAMPNARANSFSAPQPHHRLSMSGSQQQIINDDSSGKLGPRGQKLVPTRPSISAPAAAEPTTTSGGDQPTPSGNNNVTSSTKPSTADREMGTSPINNERPPSSSGAVSPGATSQQEYKPTHVDGDIDEKTALMMQSPVFLSFRHQILRDIGDRLSSNRHAQSSDFDLELLDIRNELRQRVTPQRVIELIRQYSDQETPNRVAAMHRRLQEVEVDKVSHSFLNEALRAKGDLHVVESKADRASLKELDESFKNQFFTLRQEFDNFQRERNEFQVLREVLKTQQQQSAYHHHLTAVQQQQQQYQQHPTNMRAPSGEDVYGPNGEMIHDIQKLVREEDTREEVQRRAAESLPSIKTPQRALLTGQNRQEYVVPKTPDPTYPPSSQGVDSRSKASISVIDDSKKSKGDDGTGTQEGVARDHIQETLREVHASIRPISRQTDGTGLPIYEKPTPEPPVRRDATSRQGKRVPTVRPLTDHRQRDREMAAVSGGGGVVLPRVASTPNGKQQKINVSSTGGGVSDHHANTIIREGAGSPMSMIPAKASIPQASKLKQGSAPSMATAGTVTPTGSKGGVGNTSSTRKGVQPQQSTSSKINREDVVPMTGSQVAYAQFVAEANVVAETESGPVPAYKDLKTREYAVQHNV